MRPPFLIFRVTCSRTKAPASPIAGFIGSSASVLSSDADQRRGLDPRVRERAVPVPSNGMLMQMSFAGNTLFVGTPKGERRESLLRLFQPSASQAA